MIVAGLYVTGGILHSAAKKMPELQAQCWSWRDMAFICHLPSQFQTLQAPRVTSNNA